MAGITVVGLGFSEDSLTLGALNAMRAAKKVILRTGRCEAAGVLYREGIAFSTLDAFYENAEDFESLNEKCATFVIEEAKTQDVVYGVFDLRDSSAALIAKRAPSARFLPGPCEEGALFAFADGDVLCLNASDWERFRLDARYCVLLREVVTRELAAECKLRLSDCYPDEAEIRALLPGGEIRAIPLCDMDRLPDEAYDHRLSFAIPAVLELTRLRRFGVTQLMDIMARLRAPDGCPWDREQTHGSLRQDLLEEAYEAADAIDNGSAVDMAEEFGDVLLQVAFHARIGAEHGEFDWGDVVSGVCEKLVRRHPHVFGEMHADTADDVLELWQKVKMVEKSQSTQSDSMASVARALPALTRARKVAKRACAVKFCAPDDAGALAKVREELNELAAEAPGTPNAEAEMGDLLFAIADAAVQMHIDPERALEKATDKFLRRFTAMEQKMLAAGRSFDDVTLSDMDAWWDEVKREERGIGGNA